MINMTELKSKIISFKSKYEEMSRMKSDLDSIIKKARGQLEKSKLKEVALMLENYGIVSEDAAVVSSNYSDDDASFTEEVGSFYDKVMKLHYEIGELKVELSSVNKDMERIIDVVSKFNNDSIIKNLLRAGIINRKISVTVTKTVPGDLLSTYKKKCIVFNNTQKPDNVLIFELKRGTRNKGAYVVVFEGSSAKVLDTIPEDCLIEGVY